MRQPDLHHRHQPAKRSKRPAWSAYTSVAIGADGNPIISHFNNTNSDLELYVWSRCGLHVGHQPHARNGRLRRLLPVGCDRGRRQPDHQPPRRHQQRFGVVRVRRSDLHIAALTAVVVTLVRRGDVGFYPSVAIGADGNPIISHPTAPTAIWSCTCAGCGLHVGHEPLRFETAGFVGDYTSASSVAIGADGRTRSSATATPSTAIWSCTCARMRPARRH